MAVFNGASYLSDSIMSVLSQKSVDLELIVVNDGSTDCSLDIIRAYAARDKRVKVVNRPNSGRPSIPKNDGIAAATGEYICFLDQDDLYDADRTMLLVGGLDRNADWVAVFSDMRLIDGAGSLLPRPTYLGEANFVARASPYLTALKGNWFECSDNFFRFQSLALGSLHTSTVLIAPGRLPTGVVKFDTQFTVADDVDLWMRLGLCGKIGYHNRALSSYRLHDSNTSRNNESMETDTERLHKHNFERVKNRLTSDEVQKLKKRVAGCVRSVAYIRTKEFRLAEARIGYRESFLWSPSREAAVGYLKTFIPVKVLRLLKNSNHPPAMPGAF